METITQRDADKKHLKPLWASSLAALTFDELSVAACGGHEDWYPDSSSEKVFRLCLLCAHCVEDVFSSETLFDVEPTEYLNHKWAVIQLHVSEAVRDDVQSQRKLFSSALIQDWWSEHNSIIVFN